MLPVVGPGQAPRLLLGQRPATLVLVTVPHGTDSRRTSTPASSVDPQEAAGMPTSTDRR
ncbi:hypothetical protein KPATCC21470_1672 [Kitasatospora purpeofusca]